MTEEVTEEATEDVAENTDKTPSETSKYSAIEQEALEKGWIPESEFKEKGIDKPFRDAQAFLDLDSFYGKIASQKRQIDGLEGTVRNITAEMTAMKGSYESVQRIAKEKAIKDLKREHETAIKDENFDRAGEILNEIEEEAKVPEKTEVQVPQQPDPDYVEWVNQNEWYLTDPILQSAVDAFADQVFKKGTTFTSPKAMYATFTDHAKRLYPDKFGEPRIQRTAPKVEGSKRSDGNSNKKVTRSDIPEDYRSEYDRQVANGMKPEAIVAGWKEVGLEF